MTPKSLLQSLKPAAVWASRKSNLAILECFRFRGGKVLTTDITAQTTYEVEGIEDLDCCINVAALTRSLSAMPPDDTLRISIEKGRAVLKAGRSRHVLQTMPADSMPTIEVPKNMDGFISIPNLSGILKRIEPFQAPNGYVRYYLVGTHLHTKRGHLFAEATDGNRAAQWKLDPVGGEFSITIPRIAAGRLHDLASPSIMVDEDSQTMHVSDGGAVTSVKLVDGVYPDISRVIPANLDDPLTMDCKSLQIAVSSASVAAAASKHRGIRISLSGNYAAFSRVSDGCEVESESGLEFEGSSIADALDFGMNDEYLRDAIASMKGDKIWLNPSRQASVIRDPSDPGWVCVIMSMKL